MNEKEIQEQLNDGFDIKGGTKINPNGVVDVKGDVENATLFIEGHLTVQFGTVTGSFVMSVANLSSLKGSPQVVGGNFDCSNNTLSNLEGAPITVGGSFNCAKNNLHSLQGLPTSIGKNASNAPIVTIGWSQDLGLLKLLTNDISYGSSKSPIELINAPDDVVNIINKYAVMITGGTGRKAAAISCSIDLIRAGYRANAKL